MTWKPTMDLRFVLVDHRQKLLQQKWAEYAMYAVQTAPNAPAEAHELETANFEWRDVPLVDEEDSDDRAD